MMVEVNRSRCKLKSDETPDPVSLDSTMSIRQLAVSIDPIEHAKNWLTDNQIGRRIGALAAGTGLVIGAIPSGDHEARADIFGSRDTIIKNSGSVAIRVCAGEKDFWSSACVDPHVVSPGSRSWDSGVRDVESIVVPPRHKLLTYVYTDGEWRPSIAGNNCGSKKATLVSAGSLPAQRKTGAPTQTVNVKLADCPAYAKPKDEPEHHTPSSLGVKLTKNNANKTQTSTPFTDWLKNLQNGGKTKTKPSKKSSKGSSDVRCSEPWPLGLPEWQKEKEC